MTTAEITSDQLNVPETLEECLDPAWLTKALAPVSGGSEVVSVELTEVLKAMASKVRVEVRFANDPDKTHHYCLKAFLGWDTDPTTIREARFYSEIGPQITTRVPGAPSAVIDHDAERAILIMDDMIVAGAHFCSALETITVDQAAQSLDQFARLHAAGQKLHSQMTWLPERLTEIAESKYFTVELVQSLLDDPRGEPLADKTRNAQTLFDGMDRMNEIYGGKPNTLCHGDCHAGNMYLTAEGPGLSDWQLVHRGTWSTDVAYHLCAILPVEIAEKEERRLLDHYLDCVSIHGGTPVDNETAWEEYRRSHLYGFYHWAITQRVRPVTITHEFTKRLGAAVERHDTYKLLGM